MNTQYSLTMTHYGFQIWENSGYGWQPIHAIMPGPLENVLETFRVYRGTSLHIPLVIG